MSEAPKVCMYCDGNGAGTSPENPCGFCDKGKPLDTQEDWDNSWGLLEDFTKSLLEAILNNRKEGK